MAGSFATTADGQGGTLISGTLQGRAAVTVDASASRVTGGPRLGALGSGRTTALGVPALRRRGSVAI